MATTSHIETSPRIEISALNNYIKKKIAPIYRKSIFLAEMKARGLVEYNKSGQQVEWRPRFRRRRMNVGAGSPANISTPRVNTKKKAQLPWRSYDLGESVTKFEILATQGKEGWFKILDDCINEISGDFLDHFGEKFYVDGNASATSEELHGLESWFGYSGLVTDSKVGDPNDSYAGLSTALGVSGSWTPETGGGWPTGTGYTEYCWWSPMIVDFNHADFSGSTANWFNQWQDALSYCLTYLMVLQSTEPDICIMAPGLLHEAKQSLKSQQRFETTRDSTLAKLGFKTLTYEGLEIATEYGVPEAVAYVLSMDKLHLWSMQGDLIAMAQDADLTTSERLIAVDTYSQLWTDSPAYHGKLVGISTEGT